MKKVVDKRAALLSAALELFAENGFNASPTALIARRAGVASGTLFVYFKSKEELIRELFREVNQQFHALAWENFEELPIKERLLAALRQFLRYFLTHPKEFKFGEQYHFSPYYNSEPATSDLSQKLRELLLQAREEKIIKDAPLLVLESLAIGPILALAKEHASRGARIDEAVMEEIVLGCWDGLKR